MTDPSASSLRSARVYGAVARVSVKCAAQAWQAVGLTPAVTVDDSAPTSPV